MKIHEYADSVPFWIAIDIHGSGLEWQLAFLRTNDLDEREIVYPIAEFDDYWDAEHFSKYDQVPVLFAEETKDVRQNLQCIAYSENLDLDDAKALASELLTEIYPPHPNAQDHRPLAAKENL